MSVASFNPYKIKITEHAAKRFAERHLGYKPHTIKSDLIALCRDRMRDDMMAVYTQHPAVVDGRRYYRTLDQRIYVLNANCSKVITYYRADKQKSVGAHKQVTHR